MIHLLCSWIYTTNREKVCIGWLENFWWSSRKGQDGNHNKQFFTSTEHQEGAAKITQACKKKKKKNHSIQLWACPPTWDNFSKPFLVGTLKHTCSESHLAGRQSSLSVCKHSVVPGAMGERSEGSRSQCLELSLSRTITSISPRTIS